MSVDIMGPMGFKDGFSKMLGAFKGMGNVQAPAKAGGALLAQQRVDRAALKAGAKYVDIGRPNNLFNVSGNLPKSAK